MPKLLVPLWKSWPMDVYVRLRFKTEPHVADTYSHFDVLGRGSGSIADVCVFASTSGRLAHVRARQALQDDGNGGLPHQRDK